MADIELVIKIPEKVYEKIQKRKVNHYDIDDICQSVFEGTPLPKGHGRLIDADALKKTMCDREERVGGFRALCESSAVSVALDIFAPTIIEADKEGEK